MRRLTRCDAFGLTSAYAGLRERLEAQIQQELASTSTSNVDISSRIPAELPPLFASSSFLSSELERVSSGSKATGGLDATRYSLPAPPAGAPAEAWKKAIDNAGAQLEHQQIRLSNLELMQKYAGNSWRVSNFLIEKEIERLGASSEEVRRRTEEINRERKAKQVRSRLMLSLHWSELPPVRRSHLIDVPLPILRCTHAARSRRPAILARVPMDDARLWQPAARAGQPDARDGGGRAAGARGGAERPSPRAAAGSGRRAMIRMTSMYNPCHVLPCLLSSLQCYRRRQCPCPCPRPVLSALHQMPPDDAGWFSTGSTRGDMSQCNAVQCTIR